MSPIVRKKGEKFKLPSQYWLLVLTLVCCGLIILSFNTSIFKGPLDFIANYLIVPFQNGVSVVGMQIKDKSDELVQIRDLLEENERLQAQVDELTIQNTELQQDRYELNTLRELYELDEQYDEYEKTGARIIARDSGNWYHNFVINKGSDHGIEVDMNVIAGSGLVGRVTEVGPDWSKVLSIIADNSNVSATLLSTEEHLIVSGDLELYSQGSIRFSQLIDRDEKVAHGDKIVTSNISDKYLPGILIGYIESLDVDSNNLTKSGEIIPAVDFGHLDEVLVILDKKQTVNKE